MLDPNLPVVAPPADPTPPASAPPASAPPASARRDSTCSDSQSLGASPRPSFAAASAVSDGALAIQTTTPLPATRLHLDAAQRLWLTRGRDVVQVKPVRCFPWSSPGELISLRDEQDDEHLLVEDPSTLDATSTQALEAALRSVGFVLEVQSIESIEEDFEVRVWHTRTRQGKRTFQTKLDEWPWPAPGGGHLVRDLAGDLFRLPPLETLDKKTRAWLWAYVD